MKTVKKIEHALLLTFILLFSLGQLQRVALGSNVHIYAHDLIILIWLVVFFIQKKKRTLFFIWLKSAKKIMRQNLVALAWATWLILGMLVAYSQTGNLLPWAYATRVVCYAVFALTIQISVRREQNYLKYMWVSGGVLVLLLGLLQYFFLPDTRFLMSLGWDDHYYRLIGTQLDPAFTGMILVLTANSTLFLMRDQQLRTLRELLLIVLSFGIAATYSRATYVSFAVVLIVYWLTSKVKKQDTMTVMLMTGVLIASVVLLPKPTGEGVDLTRKSTISARVATNQHSLLTLDTPEWIIGRGLFTPKTPTTSSTQKLQLPNQAHFPDNLFVFLLTSTGLPGLILGCVVLLQVAHHLYQKNKPVFVAFSAVIVHSQFNHTLLQPFVLLYFLGILSVSTTRK